MEFEETENVYESWDEPHTIWNQTTVIVFFYFVSSSVSRHHL